MAEIMAEHKSMWHDSGVHLGYPRAMESQVSRAHDLRVQLDLALALKRPISSGGVVVKGVIPASESCYLWEKVSR